MSVKDEQICRLCLKVAKEEFKIDGIKKGMLEILLLKLNLDITRNPILCQNCMDVAKKCLQFKYTWIFTEKIILSYSFPRKNVKYDIRVIYQDRENERSVLNEDFNVCRFCMTPLEIDNRFTLKALMADSMFEMLSPYMVEMDFDTIENPTACSNCKKNLDCYFKFALNCLDIEEKIKEYCKEKRTDKMGQVKLSNVLPSMFTYVLEYPYKSSQTCKIEHEHTKCTFVKVYSGLIKQEDSGIQDEETIMDGTSYRNASEINVKRKLTNNSDAIETDMDEYNLSIFEVKQQQILKNQISICKEDDISIDMGIYPMHKYLCAYEAKQESNLTTHMLVQEHVSEKNMYKCSLCTYETKQKRHLKTHILVHTDVSEIQMHKCSSCAYEAKRKCDLTRHMLVHKNVSEIRMYNCSLCSYEAKHKNNLKKHMLIHKDVSETRMYKCSLCAYETKRNYDLTRHMLVHKNVSEIRTYKCSLCTYEAKHKSNVTEHMLLVHKNVSEIRMYKCSLCVYRAKRKSDLNLHMLVHKDVSQLEMYKCSVCTYEAKQKSRLTTHMLVHKDVSEIRMYNCSLCPYESKRKGQLKAHLLVHKDVSEIEMYKCLFCAYKSKRKSHLIRHMLVHKDISR